LADISYRRGELAQSCELYRSALALAPHDPDLEQMVRDLERRVALQASSQAADAMSLDEMGQALARAAVPTALSSNAEAITAAAPSGPSNDHVRAVRTLAALEQWLEAIHAARAQPRA
jgi:hypothetical protein